MSELKCCKRCGAFATCDHKGTCCIECEYFDPVDMLCMAIPEKKTQQLESTEEKEIDPVTFLFEDDDEDDDDTGDLPAERESNDDVDFDDD